jgi:hypothetical protein
LLIDERDVSEEGGRRKTDLRNELMLWRGWCDVGLWKFPRDVVSCPIASVVNLVLRVEGDQKAK